MTILLSAQHILFNAISWISVSSTGDEAFNMYIKIKRKNIVIINGAVNPMIIIFLVFFSNLFELFWIKSYVLYAKNIKKRLVENQDKL